MKAMSNLIMIPIHLDALWLETERSVVEAIADFSRLPYPKGTQDVNPDTANISENIVSQPFQNQNLLLNAGIHLHWALPDALTKGIHRQQSTTFPPVPNRWLISRSQTGSSKKQWVVESDFLYREETGSQSGSVTIPFPTDPIQGKHQPFRYMGRKLPLAAWQEIADDGEYLHPFTAIGYGEPTFAAFYPNCHSVFGFYDAEHTDKIPPGLQYDVIGWYSAAQQDALNRFVNELIKTRQSHDSDSASNLHKLLEEEFSWTVVSQPVVSQPEELSLPLRFLCYARLTFQPSGNSSENLALKAADTKIIVGNTGTEALSAHLAQTLDNNYKSILEDQLEALHLSSRLESRQLDIGPKFQEARHEKGFKAIPAGYLWTISLDTNRTAPANADSVQEQAQVTLPEDIAHQLNRLNQLQWEYDRSLLVIESRRKQLFSDWYKYMLCAYPPEDSRDDYPDIDEVKHYIEQKGLTLLVSQIADTGNLMLQQDKFGKILSATAEDSASTSLASQLAIAITDLLSRLADQNQNKSLQKTQAAYTLRLKPSPQYWQPTEPVVLITGETAQPTLRHGQDGRLRKDGLLECQVLQLQEPVEQSAISKHFSEISRKIDAIQASLSNPDQTSIAFSTWTQQPWNPFLLEWNVEVFPRRSSSNLQTNEREYQQDFITNSYALAENQVDFSTQAEQNNHIKAANVYSGSSILTPQAGIKLQIELEAYLKQQLPDDYYQQLSQNVDTVSDWYTQKYLASASSKDKAKDPVYTAIRAYSVLQGLNCLSQALGGFNEALLMHKQTFQLSIADPLEFDDHQSFTAAVRDGVQGRIKSAPEPLNDFNPIRSGVMKILRLRLVDTFGQVKDLDGNFVTTAETMNAPDSKELVSLPPRLVQPARLNIRWLSASQGEQEMNDQPATSPICGWIVPNNLDNSLMIYDNQGRALGSLAERSDQPSWQPAPGSNTAIAVTAIANPHLNQLVRYLLSQNQSFFNNFISALDDALENIDPENVAQHPELALLMGRPIAVVRAAVNLEVQGLPAIHQGWNVFRQDMKQNARETDNFEHVKFPIRIGEYRQLNDGVVGYWKENEDGYEDDIFYVPQSNVTDDRIKSHANDPINLFQTIKAPPQTLTLLVDPRGKVHATCGILPTKAIDIPPDQYVTALQAIEVTFLSTPILTDSDKVQLSLPGEAGYTWSWLAKMSNEWTEISSTGTVQKQIFLATFSNGEEIWNRLKARGWIVELEANNASVSAKDTRTNTTLGEDMDKQATQIETILDSAYIHTVNLQATFSGQQVIREGWLKLSRAKP